MSFMDPSFIGELKVAEELTRAINATFHDDKPDMERRSVKLYSIMNSCLGNRPLKFLRSATAKDGRET